MAYVEILRRHLAVLPEPPPRISDRAFYSNEGIRAVFAEQYADLAIEPILLDERLTPEATWGSFARMYDLYHLSQQSRLKIRDEYLGAVQSMIGPDGRLAFPQQLRCIRAHRL